MSEEEKKAVDILINEIADIVISEYCTHCKICENEDTECYYIKTIDTVNNLIEKQQKEIKVYKKEIELQGYITKDYISKDKIMEIAKKNDTDFYIDTHNFFIDIMKLLN